MSEDKRLFLLKPTIIEADVNEITTIEAKTSHGSISMDYKTFARLCIPTEGPAGIDKTILPLRVGIKVAKYDKEQDSIDYEDHTVIEFNPLAYFGIDIGDPVRISPNQKFEDLNDVVSILVPKEFENVGSKE